MTTLSEPHDVRFLGASWDAEAHVEDTIDPNRTFTGLCGIGLWESNRLDTPTGRTLCTLCGEIADSEGYSRDGIRKFYPSYNGMTWTADVQPAAVAS